MNIEDVNRCISQLEDDDMTFSNCQKLSSLIIVREFLNSRLESGKFSDSRQVERELSDILPHYEKYCSLKKEYQLNRIGKETVIDSLKSVCKEINEFIQALYSSTDTPEERAVLRNLVGNITF